MDQAIQARIERLRTIEISEVIASYAEVFGREPNSTHRDHLVRRIAWKLQALEQGEVSEEATRRAFEIALDIELDGRRGSGPRPSVKGIRKKNRLRGDPRLPAPGTELTREYRGKTAVVKILAKGFEYEGQHYRSLSAIARAITGTPWNGLVFFGLAKRGEAPTLGKQKPNTKARSKPSEKRHAA